MYATTEATNRQDDGELEAARHMLEAMARQTELMEEIRDQFAEHLELQRQILRVLVIERHV